MTIKPTVYEDDGPPTPEPELPSRLDGFCSDKDIVPTSTSSGTSLLDRTDRGDWPDIVEINSPVGGSGKRK